MERAVHHIKQQIFDIYAEDAERAHEIQLAIRHIASTELNIIAERLLDAFSIENYDIKIEQLKLDLGNVPIENLTRELPIRFEKALYEALSELISPVGELSTHQPKNVEIKSRDEANIDIIHFFLQYGRFPWWAKKDHFQFHILFNQQLSQNPTSIVNLLRDNKNQTAFFVRLSLQLSFHTLFHLLKSALKEHAAFIYEWIERQQKESSGSFTAKQAEKRRLLSKILKYIFQHQDNFSQEKFLAEMERAVSKDNLADYESQKEMDGASQNEEAKLANIEFFLQNGAYQKISCSYTERARFGSRFNTYFSTKARSN